MVSSQSKPKLKLKKAEDQNEIGKDKNQNDSRADKSVDKQPTSSGWNGTAKKVQTEVKSTGKEEGDQRKFKLYNKDQKDHTEKDQKDQDKDQKDQNENQTEEKREKKDLVGRGKVKGPGDALKTNKKPSCEDVCEKEGKLKKKSRENKPKKSEINESFRSTEVKETNGEKHENEQDEDPEKFKTEECSEKGNSSAGGPEKQGAAQNKADSEIEKGEAQIGELSVECENGVERLTSESYLHPKIATEAFAAKRDTGKTEEATLDIGKDGKGEVQSLLATCKGGGKKQTGSLEGLAGGGQSESKEGGGEEGEGEEGEGGGENRKKETGSLGGITGGGGQLERCKLEDIETILAEVRGGEEVDRRCLEDSCCKVEGGEEGGEDGEGGDEGGKIAEYEGEVCKESAADDVNASAEGPCKNVRPWNDDIKV